MSTPVILPGEPNPAISAAAWLANTTFIVSASKTSIPSRVSANRCSYLPSLPWTSVLETRLAIPLPLTFGVW